MGVFPVNRVDCLFTAIPFERMEASLSPPSALPSAVFRPRRSEDWQEFRSIIEKLYRDDQLKLRDVKAYMEKHYNFVASEKQYKDRLAAWGIRKNIKAKEVQFMIRKQQKRAAQGKHHTAFRVGGQKVDSKRIARFINRYSASWNEMDNSDDQEPKTPSDMSCYTPEPEDMHTTPGRESSATSTYHESELEQKADNDCSNDCSENSVNGRGHGWSSVPASNVQRSPSPSESRQPMQEVNEEEEIQQQQQQPVLTWQDLVDYQQRMAIMQQQLSESLGRYIDPYDDDSVGCLSNGDRPRLF